MTRSDSMLRHVLAVALVLLLVAEDGLAQHVTQQGIHFLFPKTFTWLNNSVNELSRIEWGTFRNARGYLNSINNCSRYDLFTYDISSGFINWVQEKKLSTSRFHCYQHVGFTAINN